MTDVRLLGPRAAPPPAPLASCAAELARERRAASGAARDERHPTLLFCGGFHSSMQGTKARHIDALAGARGLACVRFDYRGHGDSPGDVRTLGIGHWLADTLATIDDIAGPILAIGSSMGAWLAALAAFERPDRVIGLLTLAAAPDFTERRLLASLAPQERAHLDAGEIANRHSAYDDEPWPLPPILFDSGRAHALLTATRIGSRAGVRPDAPTRTLGVPLALLHGTADVDVPDALSRELLDTIGGYGDELLLLAGADHRLSDPASLAAIEQALDRLLARCVANDARP